MMAREVPLIAHIIHRLDVGGMENGVVNLINHMPSDRYRHAVVSLTDSTRFRDRIRRDDVQFFSLHKTTGHDLGLYVRLFRVLRHLRPAIVHTRNLASLESVVPAALAGVPCRVHGEHGRDVQDVDGDRRRYRWLRRVLSPLVHRFIALSRDLEHYLVEGAGVRASKVVRICNGVDLTRFRPPSEASAPLPEECGFEGSGYVVIGSVTRMQEVKDPVTLARAFVQLVERGYGDRVRLVMVGDGPLLEEVSSVLKQGRADRYAWLAGRRDDVPRLLQAFDVFALSSRVEGISNTILEAMASGLPVVATRVGGNAELVLDGATGALVPRSSPNSLAEALARYVDDDELRKAHGGAARLRAEEEFDLGKMVAKYMALYDNVLAERGVQARPATVDVETRSTCAG